jgi:hypothetical protein
MMMMTMLKNAGGEICGPRLLAILCNSGQLDIIIGRWALLSGLVGTKEIWHSYSYNMLEEERLRSRDSYDDNMLEEASMKEARDFGFVDQSSEIGWCGDLPWPMSNCGLTSLRELF